MKKIFFIFIIFNTSIFLSAELNLMKKVSFGTGYGPTYGNLGLNSEIDLFNNECSLSLGFGLSSENNICYNVGTKFYFNTVENIFRPGLKSILWLCWFNF